MLGDIALSVLHSVKSPAAGAFFITFFFVDMAPPIALAPGPRDFPRVSDSLFGACVVGTCGVARSGTLAGRWQQFEVLAATTKIIANTKSNTVLNM